MANKKQRRRQQERRRRQAEARARNGLRPFRVSWAGLKPWEPVKMRLYQAPQIFPESMTTQDRRGYYAVLTEEGRPLFAQPIHRRDIQEHFARHLSDADVQALTQIIGKVRQAIQPSTE